MKAQNAHPVEDERLDFGSVGEFAQSAKAWPVTWRIRSPELQFAARVRRRTFGDFLLGEMRYQACSGVRGSNEIAQSNERYICLTQYDEGGLRFGQAGRSIDIHRNDLVLWDASVPTTFDCRQETGCKIVWIPARAVERRVGGVAPFLGRRISGAGGTAAILGPYFRSLHAHIDTVPAAVRPAVIDASIELIFSLFDLEGAATSGAPALSGPRGARLLQQARQMIADGVEGDALHAADVARELGIGTRYLHKIFAAGGQTFSACVAQERLERAHAALLAPSLRDASVTELAHRFGYYDSSHFNRVFRTRFGQSPAAYRAERLPR